MPGSAGQLRKLYQHTSGGVNPPQAPSVSGDIGAMLKYLVASPPGLPEIRKAMVVPAMDETDGQTLQATMGWSAGVNVAQFVPFYVDQQVTVTRIFTYIGNTGAGNYDVGIYSEAGSRLASLGGAAVGGGSSMKVADIADLILPKGTYYFASVYTDASCTPGMIGYKYGFNQGGFEAHGGKRMTAAYPLPASATFSSPTSGNVSGAVLELA